MKVTYDTHVPGRGFALGRAGIAAALLLAFASASWAAKPDLTPRYNDPTDAYTRIEVEGWTLMVNQRLDKQPKIRREAIETMRWQLWMIQRIVPGDAVAVMKGVTIWLEDKNVGRTQYHDDRKWLAEHNYNPDKARGVDVGDVTRHMNRPHGSAAMVLLHELIHAWHDQKLGFDDARIIAAYKKSLASGVYDQVLNDRRNTVRHYALSNHKEWFAEISETYLWSNDYYPFNRAELRKADPQAYALMEEIWSMRKPSSKRQASDE
jgi:hypothetical protein